MFHPQQWSVPFHLCPLSASPPGNAPELSGDTSAVVHPAKWRWPAASPPFHGSAIAPAHRWRKDRPVDETDRACRSITARSKPAHISRYFALSGSSVSSRRNAAPWGETVNAATFTSRCASREKTCVIVCHSASSASSPPFCNGFQ